MLDKPDSHLHSQRRIHPLGILHGGGPRGITKLPDPLT
ncbi:hypothetical protein A2U01_0097963, partial [Trifolium medium]|nr:hypothetical protein [Trifolium medium]